MKTAFQNCHPVVNLVFFTAVLGFSLWLMHPAALSASLVCAVLNAFFLQKPKTLRTMWTILPMLLFAALLNPLFNHEGQTILCYLPGGNPLTQEAIFYGAAAAAMLAAVLLWFGNVNAVLTSDKLVYLFGRILPGFSLLLSMILRFVPRFREQLSRNTQALACVGSDPAQGTLPTKIRRGLTVFSGLMTWALESAMQTADSMKSRGYGLPGRSGFALYRLTRRDGLLLIWILLCGSGVLLARFSGGFVWRFYPRLSADWGGAATVWAGIAYTGLCLTPAITGGWEVIQWRISNYRR